MEKTLSDHDLALIGQCTALINKIQSLKDGGARITLDVPEYSKSVASKLLEISMGANPLIHVTFVEGDFDE